MKTNRIRRSLRVVLALAMILCLMIPALVGAAASGVADNGSKKAREASNGVVRVINQGVGMGSGFAVGQKGKPTRYFVTNWHVVADGHGGISKDIYLLLDNETMCAKEGILGPYYELDVSRAVHCTVLGDPQQFPDFAILEADDVVEERVALPLAKLDTVKALDTVYALGFPGTSDGLVGEINEDGVVIGPVNADLSSISSTTGAVNRIDTIAELGGLEYIISSCEIHGGNSGGPLLNTNGAVIGINTYSTALPDSNDVAVYYEAVPIDYVIEELDALDIDYEMDSPLPVWLIPAIIVVAVIAIACVVAVAVAKSAGAKQQRLLAAQAKAMEAQAQAMEQRLASMNAAVQAAQQSAAATAVKAPQLQAQDSGFRLVGEQGQFAGRRFAIMGRVCLGTDPSRNHLVIKPGTPGVSRRHCAVQVVNGKPCVTDRGATYGTLVNGQKLAANQSAVLKVGDVISLGSPNVSFRIDISSRQR